MHLSRMRNVREIKWEANKLWLTTSCVTSLSAHEAILCMINAWRVNYNPYSLYILHMSRMPGGRANTRTDNHEHIRAKLPQFGTIKAKANLHKKKANVFHIMTGPFHMRFTSCTWAQCETDEKSNEGSNKCDWRHRAWRLWALIKQCLHDQCVTCQLQFILDSHHAHEQNARRTSEHLKRIWLCTGQCAWQTSLRSKNSYL